MLVILSQVFAYLVGLSRNTLLATVDRFSLDYFLLKNSYILKDIKLAPVVRYPPLFWTLRLVVLSFFKVNGLNKLFLQVINLFSDLFAVDQLVD